MNDDLEHELLIFDRPDGQRVGDDWYPVAFPDTLLTEIPTAVAQELLTLLGTENVTPALGAWLGFLRGDVRNALAQGSMFDGDAA